MAYITLLHREVKNIEELERILNWCRAEYVEQTTDFFDLSLDDTLGIYTLLKIREDIKNGKTKRN